jgi:zinc transport system permease protein
VNILEFDFMRRALLAAALVGLAAPSIGVYLVQRRLSLMGDGIGHVAFTGVAAGLLAGVSPLVTAMIAAVLGGLIIELLRERGRTAGDVALAIIFYGGIAGGALMTYMAGTPNKALTYLFGSVLTVSEENLVIVASVSAGVLALTFALRKELFAVCYDEEVARVSGLPVRKMNLMIALTAALTIGVTMRVVGLLLVSAMLVLPVASVQQLTGSFRSTVYGSLALGVVLSIGGLIVAFYADVAPGATIVIGALLSFVVAGTLSRFMTSSARAAA